MSLVLTPKEAQGLLTKAVVAVLDRSAQAPSFLSSFFRVEERQTLGLVVEVRRNGEMIAVDVPRGSEGNLNEFNHGDNKVFIPPYYREYMVMNSLQHYYRVFGSNNVELPIFKEFVQEIVNRTLAMIAKIKRSIELQCAQVFEDGIVTLANGENIDYGRNALSKVDLSATPWSNNANDPIAHMGAGATWVRANAQIQAAYFDIIMGELAYPAFLDNQKVKDKADIKSFNLIDLKTPQANAWGGVFHGEISIGSHKGRVWTHPQVYVDKNGVKRPYIDDKKIVMIPQGIELVLGFAAVPQVVDLGNPQLIKSGSFVTDDYVDKAHSAHIYDVKSAPLAIPVDVDGIYTAQVLA